VMLPSGPGMRFKQLYALLRVGWKAEGQAPSEQTIRRQIKQMCDDGEVICLERNVKYGDLYRLPNDPTPTLDNSEPVE
jgi:hypothetical protein